MKRTLIALAMVATAFTSQATELLNKTDVSRKLQEISQGAPAAIKVIDIEDSPIPEFYQAITDKGIIYVAKNGKHIISGSIHNFAPGMKDLTKDRLLVEREKEVKAFEPDLITYRAPNQKHEVIVFYDTTCGYCHKLHSEIKQYNDLGITVHYAAFPRNGISDPRNPAMKTDGYNALQNIWCAENNKRSLAFEAVANNQTIPRKTCENTIEDQFNFGVKVGIQGTPAIVSMRGDMVVAGYAPPAALKARLESAGL
jgi:thiol:disulfide interchange protein DsbC